MTTRPGYVWDATASEWVEIGQAAVVSPFKYQTSQPSSPATGDIWIDSDEDVPSVNSTLYYRWTKTMSGGETSLSGTDNNSLALKYTPGYESVFINGVLQVRGSDYTATTGTTVTGLTALTANDVVMVESIVAYSVGDTYTQSTLDGKFSPITTTGLVLLNTTTIGSAVSSVTISNIFSSTYDAYKIVISGGASSAACVLQMTLGSASTGYRAAIWEVNYSGGSAVLGQNNTAFWNFGLGVPEGLFAIGDLSLPFASDQTTFTSNSVAMGIAGGTLYTRWANGFLNDTTSYTAFTITPSTGTLTGGTIKVYGYK